MREKKHEKTATDEERWAGKSSRRTEWTDEERLDRERGINKARGV